jgi:hypothetical protein
VRALILQVRSRVAQSIDSTRLEVEFGRGFGEKNLRRMIQFAELFPDEQILTAH